MGKEAHCITRERLRADAAHVGRLTAAHGDHAARHRRHDVPGRHVRRRSEARRRVCRRIGAKVLRIANLSTRAKLDAMAYYGTTVLIATPVLRRSARCRRRRGGHRLARAEGPQDRGGNPVGHVRLGAIHRGEVGRKAPRVVRYRRRPDRVLVRARHGRASAASAARCTGIRTSQLYEILGVEIGRLGARDRARRTGRHAARQCGGAAVSHSHPGRGRVPPARNLPLRIALAGHRERHGPQARRHVQGQGRERMAGPCRGNVLFSIGSVRDYRVRIVLDDQGRETMRLDLLTQSDGTMRGRVSPNAWRNAFATRPALGSM